MATGQTQMSFGYDKPVYNVHDSYNNSGYDDGGFGGYNPSHTNMTGMSYSASGGGTTSVIVGQPGPLPESREPFRNVHNWMCLSIFSLFCCWVCAVPSVAYAQAASVLKTVGRYQAAQTKAKWALGCGLTSIILGLLYITTLIILGFWGAGAFD